MSIYTALARPILFRFDSETIHDSLLRAGRFVGKHAPLRRLAASLLAYQHPALETTVAGIPFPNPVGLAAGFDKNGVLPDVLGSIGFGFAEIGSVTAEPCSGNPRPRLWRLPKDRALVVYYGLANRGAESVAARLASSHPSIPIGVSIARTNRPDVRGERAIEDYARSFRVLAPLAAYVTLNVSCPNASDERRFSEPAFLDPLLRRIGRERVRAPLFLKLKPDMTHAAFGALAAVADRYPWVTGFVISNLTTKRDGLRTDAAALARIGEQGGVSGKPAERLSNELLAHAYRTVGGRYVLIGCGGIMSGADAYHKIRLGASLVQLVTGLIYEGPTLIRRINREIVRELAADGFPSVAAAVGSAHRTITA